MKIIKGNRFVILLLFFTIFFIPTKYTMAQDGMKQIAKLKCEKFDDRTAREYERALKCYDLKDYKNAISSLKFIKQRFESSIRASKLLADIYFNLNDDQSAITEYSNVLELIAQNTETTRKNETFLLLWKRPSKLYIELNDLKGECKSKLNTISTWNQKQTAEQKVINLQNPQERYSENPASSEFPLLTDKCANPTYEDKNWIPFTNPESRSEQIDQLKKHVKNLAIKKYTTKKIPHLGSIDPITCANLSWLKETGDLRLQWFEELNKKEDRVSKQKLRINENQSQRLNIEGEIDNTKQTIKYLQQRVSGVVGDIEFQKYLRDKVIWESYYQKMATVPQYIVLIGMTKSNSKDSTSDLGIDGRLKLEAVKQISDNIITKYTLKLDDELKSIISSRKAGGTRITAQYYKNLMVWDAEGNKHIAKILQIEVTPVDTSSVSRLNTDNIDGGNQIFMWNVITPDKIDPLGEKPENRKPSDMLKLNENQKDHIKMLLKSANDQNLKYRQKSDSALYQYQSEKAKANNKIEQLLQDKTDLDSLILFNKRKLEALNAELDKKKKLEEVLYVELSNYNNSYDSVQGTMFDVTNKLSYTPSGQSNLEEPMIFSDKLARECFNAVAESGKSNIILNLSKNISENRSSQTVNERYKVEFKPKPSAFKVLSLEMVKMSNGADNDVLLFLNVAFRMHYTKSSEEKIEITGNSASAVKTEPPVLTRIMPKIEVDQPSKVIKDEQYTWQLNDVNPTSLTAFVRKNDGTMRLPTMDELKKFFSKLAYLPSGKKDFYNIFRFEKETEIFVTSDKSTESDDMFRCLIIKKDLNIAGETDREWGEQANFLLIKK